MITIKSNIATVLGVTVRDLGIIIPPAGGSDTFTEDIDLDAIRLSQNLRDLCTDDFFGAGSSTLIVNDGTNDIDQADVIEFLDTSNVSIKPEIQATDPTVNDDGTRGFSENSLWTNTTTDESFICVDPAAGAAIWTSITQSGGSTSPEAFSGYTNTNSATFTTTFTDMPIDAEITKTSGFTHTNPSPEVTIVEDGTYQIDANVTLDQVGGNNRSTAQMRVMVNEGIGFVEIDGSRARMYSRNNAQGETEGSSTFIRAFSAGDIVKVQAARFSGSGSFQFLADNCRLSIVNLRGTEGPQGPAGPGSSVIIEEEGISLGNFTNINFIGSAVTATDAGSGTADVTVTTTTPTFGQNFADNERTTTAITGSTSFVNYLTLATGSVPAGTYRVGWFYIWNGDSTSDDINVRIQVDNTTTLMEATEEPVDSLGSGINGTNQRFPRGGFAYVTFGSTASHDIDLDFSSEDGDDVAMINGRLEFWRVS